MFGPYPIEAVIERARGIATLKVVGGFASFSDALDTPPTNTPALYVLREESARAAPGVTGALIQPIDVVVKLVFMNRHSGNPEKSEAAMTAIEQSLRERFFGWRPNPEFKPLTIRASGNDQIYGALSVRQLLLDSGYMQTRQPESTP